MAEPNRDPLIGAVVRLLDAPDDPRNGGYFRIGEGWDTSHGRRYAVNEFLAHEAPAQPPIGVIRGRTWNVAVEALRDADTQPLPLASPKPLGPTTRMPTAPPPQQPMQDLLLSRRRSWTGEVIQSFACAPADPNRGHYWRVTQSHRDPETGEWWVEANEYLGSQRPTGVRVYKFDGTTWDMPALATTAFPWFTAACWVGGMTLFLSIFGSQIIANESHYWGSEGLATLVVLGMVSLMICIGVGWAWFYKIEPVRGTKVAAVAAAGYAADRARRANQEPGMYDGGPVDEIPYYQKTKRVDPGLGGPQ